MKLKFTTIYLVGTFLLFVLGVVLFGYFEYQNHKEALYKQMDEKLLSSAMVTDSVLTPAFHDRALKASSVTAAEDNRTIERLSEIAKNLNVAYLYTTIQKNGKIYFTASSATEEERKTGIHSTRYFNEYDDAGDALKQAFQTRQIHFSEYTDKWGTFRSVFLPLKSPGGNTYVISSDIRMDEIHQLVQEDVLHILLKHLAVILLSIPFMTWHLRQINVNLKKEYEKLMLDLKKHGQVLKKTYEKLHLLFDSMSEGVYEVDTNGNCTFVNNAFLKILGYQDAEELIGKNIHELIHHSHADSTPYPKHECQMLNVIENNRSIHVEDEVFWSKEGKAVPVEYWSNPVVFDGKVIAAMGTFVDISKRKEAESALQKLTLAVEQSPNSIIITDVNYNIEYVNTAFITVTGYTKSEVLGKNPQILQSGKTPRERYDEMKASLSQGKTWIGEFINKSKDGKEYTESVKISPIFQTDGKLTHYMAIKENVTDKKHSDERIHYLSNFDSLTGLPNRQKLQYDMEQHPPKASALFNIDNFKEVNDFFGLKTGDILLHRTGVWFKTMGFAPYRIGGDEFAILFYEDLTQKELHNRIASLLSALEEERFIVNNETLDIHMTVGIAIGMDKLLTRADIALHNAQERKIPIAFYEESENVEEQYRINIEMAGAVRKALVAGRIICHYQPIVNIVTGKTDKYETLVRMVDEEGKIVPPMQFLSIAKKTKLYSRITREVIHQACRLFCSRSEEFSINLSIDDIHDPITVQEIITTITQTGTASRIVFEILESDGIENYDIAAQFIRSVKALGAKIAIDDFGTGYSNFEHILSLNVDYIKIDGSLIRGIGSNPRHRIIIETIVDFAKKIGAETIAEFVSDEEIYDTVKEIGIDYSQGYYTGKPEVLP